MNAEESIYDADELAAIEGWAPRSSPPVAATTGVAGLRRSTAGGALAAAVLFGLRDALEPPPDDTQAVVADAPTEPDDRSAPVVLRFDARSPADTIAVVRR